MHLLQALSCFQVVSYLLHREILFGGTLRNSISLYHLPRQSQDAFEKFSDNFELNLDKITNKSPYLIFILVTSTLSHSTGINMIRKHTKDLKSIL